MLIFTADDVSAIIGSSAPPQHLAERYGVRVRTIHEIQHGATVQPDDIIGRRPMQADLICEQAVALRSQRAAERRAQMYAQLNERRRAMVSSRR